MPDVEQLKLGRELSISIGCVSGRVESARNLPRTPKTIAAMAQAPSRKKEAGQVFLPPFFPVTGNPG
jgi:hypothetical protein